MPQYFHAIMRCSQEQCPKKDQCYRYWLGQNFQGHDWRNTNFYHPEKPVTDGCSYFIDKNYFE